MNFGLCIIGAAGLTVSQGCWNWHVWLSFSYLRRVDVVQAFHAEDSPNGWVGYIFCAKFCIHSNTSFLNKFIIQTFELFQCPCMLAKCGALPEGHNLNSISQGIETNPKYHPHSCRWPVAMFLWCICIYIHSFFSNSRPWDGCRWPEPLPFEPKGLNYSIEVTIYDSMLSVYQRLFAEENLRILVYSGEGDATVTHVGEVYVQCVFFSFHS